MFGQFSHGVTRAVTKSILSTSLGALAVVMCLQQDLVAEPQEMKKPTSAPAVPQADPEPAYRAWTSKDGKRTQEAAFERQEDGYVYVRNRKGRLARVPIDQLSQADREYVAELEYSQADDLFEDVGESAEPRTVARVVAPPALAAPVDAGQQAMLRATRMAWEALMDADARLSRESFDHMGSRCQAVAFLYSKIPLEGVDPLLQQHITRSVTAYRTAARVYNEHVAEMQALNAQVANAAGWGHVLGGAASSPQESNANANNMALLFGGIAQAGVTAEADASYQRMVKKWEPVGRELMAIDQAENVVADALSKKYDVPFIDAF